MSDKVCKIKECLLPVHGRGFCRKHYMRWWRYGDPSAGGRQQTGRSNHSLYKTWLSIKARCYYSSHESYRYYGAKGIKMSKEWKEDFEVFYSDMGDRPSKYYDVDRIDSSGDYCKENCRWLLHTANIRRASKLSIDAAKRIREIYREGLHTQREIAKLFGVTQAAIWYVLNRRSWNV